MNRSTLVFRIGSLGLILTFLAAWEEPMAGALKLHPENWPAVAILFGFPVLLGVLALIFSMRSWEKAGRGIWMVSHGAALLTVLWLILWCFVWLAILSNLGEKAEMFIKHVSYLHLFGVGFTMAAYFTGFMASSPGEKAARFWMACGWGASYAAFFNLYLQPTLKAFWAPAVGGLVLCLGAYLLARSYKPKVETPSPTA
jgi:hypothetical protein